MLPDAVRPHTFIYSTLFVINDSSSKAIKHKHIYRYTYTHQLKHTNTHATHIIIYTRSPNINMISALPARETRVLYFFTRDHVNFTCM